MKKYALNKWLIPAGIILITISCLKTDNQWEKEQELLRQYIKANNITVEPTASGLYYIEILEGTGISPEINDYLIVEYTGKVLSSNYIFETTDSATARQNNIYVENYIYGPTKFQLSKTILGFREGLSYMKEGGEAELIIPSNLGFGQYGNQVIPPYSTLIAQIRLLEVIKDPVEHESLLLEEYIFENNITVEPQASGLYYIEEVEGIGDVPQSGQTCVVTFTGKLIDGRVFAEVTTLNPYSFIIGVTQIIPGFTEGVSYMKTGGKATIIIPSFLAYGEVGIPTSNLPPYSTLIYEIELQQITN